MTVMAMTREMGTRGKDVAAALANELGLEVVHHELVERHIAERMRVSESVVHRFLEGDASLWEQWKIDRNQISHFTAVEILELAQRGNVIIRGWGATQLLRDVPHVICARLCAPMENRVREMKTRLRIDDDTEATREVDRGNALHIRREIERNDDAHDRAVRAQFNMDWRSALGYNIVLNTAITPVSAATELLLHMSRMPEFQETDHSRQILQDKLTLARVRAIIDNGTRRALGGSLELSISNGAVSLGGVAMQTLDLEPTLDAIRAVEGVTSVRNNVRNLPSFYSA